MLVYKVNLELEENEEILAEQKELQSILEKCRMIGCYDTDECLDILHDGYENNSYGIEAVVSFAIKQGWNAKKVVEDIQSSYYFDDLTGQFAYELGEDYLFQQALQYLADRCRQRQT